MKRLFYLLPCLMLLAGCVAPGTGLPGPAVPVTGDTAQFNATVANVIAKVREACSYAATFNSIAQLVSLTGVPVIGGVGEIASQVCNSVTTAPLADGPGDHRPRVAGVIIKGKFVRKGRR